MNGLTDQEVKENYYKLGLVELGLLPKALINDRQAVEDAKLKFASSGLRNQAFEKLNARAAQEGQSLPNNWLTYKKEHPPIYLRVSALEIKLNYLAKHWDIFWEEDMDKVSSMTRIQ